MEADGMGKRDFRTSLSISTRLRGLMVVATLSIGVFAMPSWSYASKLVLAHEVYLDPGTAPASKAIMLTNDDGFLIVGGDESNSQGWAVRTDSAGDVRWHYAVQLVDKKSEVLPRFPQYNGAVVIPDNSSFLCGSMPRPGGVNWPGLLTHLDPDGKLINEQLIYPKNHQEGFAGDFDACALWGNDIIIVGRAMSFLHQPQTVSVSSVNGVEYYYWLLVFDPNGKMKWERLIPISSKLEGSPNAISPFRIMSKDKAIFVATRNGVATEIVAIDQAGNVTGKNVLNEQFTAVIPVSQSSSLQLISLTSHPVKLLTLADDLHVAGQIEKEHGAGLIVRAYSMYDGSLMLFGSEAHNGNDNTARVMSLDSTLENEQALRLGPKQESYWVDAAVPLDKSGRFASVRSATRPDGIMNPIGNLRSRLLGAALDFVTLNNPGED